MQVKKSARPFYSQFMESTGGPEVKEQIRTTKKAGRKGNDVDGDGDFGQLPPRPNPIVRPPNPPMTTLKAGIKGKRLELYVSYGMPDNTGFYAPGCGATVESLGALKKAKKLFVWLEGADGYTIRKFSFKGDNYTVSERTYSTQEGAYAGCR